VDKVKEQILSDLYDNKKISSNNYDLQETDRRLRESELAYNLFDLRDNGYIKFNDSKALIIGGHTTKYNNRVSSVLYPEEIKINPIGKSYISKKRLSKLDNFGIANRSFLSDVFKKIRSLFVDLVASTTVKIISFVVALVVVIWIFK
jgi:hypothetical protein